MILSTIIEIIKKNLPVFDKSTGIFYNGEYNAYPQQVDYLIDNSVTALTCQKMMMTYVGGSWENGTEIKMNKQENLLHFNQSLSNSITRHRGYYIHFNYGFVDNEYIPVNAKVLPYAHCRLGKKDDNEYNGKIGVTSDWGDQSTVKWFDVYNPKIALKQSQKRNFKGQVLFFSMDNFRYYPFSQLHPVMNDAESEIQAGVYKNAGLTKGYFGATWVVTRPIVESGLNEDDVMKVNQKRESQKFEENIQNSMGASNASNVHWIQMDFDSMDDIEKQFVVKNFPTNLDDKMFEFTETSTANNLRKAFGNVPAIFIENSQGSYIHSVSGEAINQAKEYYYENTKTERDVLINTINHIFRDMKKEAPIYIPIYKDESKTE